MTTTDAWMMPVLLLLSDPTTPHVGATHWAHWHADEILVACLLHLKSVKFEFVCSEVYIQTTTFFNFNQLNQI